MNTNREHTIEEVATEHNEERQELKLQKFVKLLHKEPDLSEVKTSQISDDLKYLPISSIEMLLDELFFGLWQIDEFSFKQIGNDLHAQQTLKVFHPIAKLWINRVGVASMLLEMVDNVGDDGMAGTPNILSHLKAECLKNAARSLGKAFGRDLNRDVASQYKPIVPAE